MELVPFVVEIRATLNDGCIVDVNLIISLTIESTLLREIAVDLSKTLELVLAIILTWRGVVHVHSSVF